MDPIAAIPVRRESVVVVFRYRALHPQSAKNHKRKAGAQSASFNVGWGSGVCIVADRYILTAFHVLNAGQPRNPTDRFVAFTVPHNGDQAFHFPVTAFPVEQPDVDLAILEIGPCATTRRSLCPLHPNRTDPVSSLWDSRRPRSWNSKSIPKAATLAVSSF